MRNRWLYAEPPRPKRLISPWLKRGVLRRYLVNEKGERRMLDIYTKDNKEIVAAERKFKQDFIDAVEKRMKEKGFNRAALGVLIGADAPMVYRMLDPKANVSVNTIIRAAYALEMPDLVSISMQTEAKPTEQ